MAETPRPEEEKPHEESEDQMELHSLDESPIPPGPEHDEERLRRFREATKKLREKMDDKK